MGSRKNGLLEGQAVFDPFAVVALEEIIELDHPNRHQPDYPSEMPVASFGDPAVPVILTGLIDRRVQSSHGDQLVVGIKLLDLTPHLDQEGCGRLVPNAPNGGQDLDILLQGALAELDQGVGHLPQVLFEVNQDRRLLPEDHLPGRICRSYRRPGEL